MVMRIEEIRIDELNEEIKALEITKDLVSNKKEILSLINERKKERKELIDELTKHDEATKNLLRLFIKVVYLNRPLKQAEQYRLLEIIRNNFERNKVNFDKKRCGLGTWLNFLDFNTDYYSTIDDNWATLVINDEFDDEEWE